MAEFSEICYTLSMNTHAYTIARGIVSIFLIGGIFLAPTLAYAADKSNAEALVLIQSARSLSLNVLESQRFGIGFKNVSGAPWKKGRDPITLRSKARTESYFYHPSWTGRTSIMGLPQDVANGELVYFWFTLEAPKTAGSYREELLLINSGRTIATLIIPITVTASGTTVLPQQKQAPAPITALPMQALAPPSPENVTVLTATTLIKSAQSLIMKQYERVTFGIGYKNTSDRAWRASDAITLRSKVARESFFYDASWKSGNVVMPLSRDVAPGEIMYFWFTLFAPIYPRDFQENLALYSGETKIFGSDITIPITVMPASSSILTTAPASPLESTATLIETQQPGVQADAPAAPSLIPAPRAGIVDDKTEHEPFIRVGLFHTIEPIRFTATKEYDVRDQDGGLIATGAAGTETTVQFDFSTRQYTITTPSGTYTTEKYIRMRGTSVPYRIVTKGDGSMAVEPVADQDTLFEVRSFINNTSWSTTINDNMFRGEMEVRYAPATNRLWVVNELLFEQYLKGIAETSNSSPFEYQKALIVAARTYAKQHIDRNSKHAAEGFTVRPTEADQVYRGYNSEKRMPSLARAVEETRGVMVYYNGALAITPYSSNTDGRTRSWEEVWGGPPKPWLVSVPDPCCTGLSMRYSSTSYSHGVGMSARGALAMALDNKSFEEILKYYYTNIELLRKY